MFNLQLFEEAAKENGVRFWPAEHFMQALGYESWPSFSRVINKAIAACANIGVDIQDAFIPCEVVDGGRVRSSYRLTRFACFLVAMHADSKKEAVALAKIVLADLADQLIGGRVPDGSFERIEIREELEAGESIMAGVARGAGLDSGEFGIFKDAGFRGMYNMSLRELVSYKGAPPEKTLYDFMGKTELAANLFRVTQTAERIKNNSVSGLNRLKNTASQVGREVRDVMLRSSGVAPEHLPIEENINSVKRGLKNAHKEMRRLDAGKPKGKRK